MFFRDRIDAGRQLAELLRSVGGEAGVGHGVGDGSVVVLGLPRGGVPVAAEVARSLGVPLDVIVVRKLGVPFHPELAMGAIGEDGARIVDADLVRSVGVTEEQVAAVESAERVELERRVHRYRGGRPPVRLEGRTALIVDDGMATGSTALAATQVARQHGAAKVVVAVPVASSQAVHELQRHADEVICVEVPAVFHAVGQWYTHFAATPDDEVIELLEADRRRHESQPGTADPPATNEAPGGAGRLAVDREVTISDGAATVAGHLTLPAGATGLVLFAHGSGSSRRSPRNVAVAAVLQHAGLGTLLFDLLTPQEELVRSNVFDIALLARRLLVATEWVATAPATRGLPLGYFGASTGAGAALWAAAEPGATVAAVVSRGGRPDLAGARLAAVRAPTLLIVGGHDPQVLEMNREAAALLGAEHRLEIVPGATHLFEEPGTLQVVAVLARDWFVQHLSTAQGAAP